MVDWTGPEIQLSLFLFFGFREGPRTQRQKEDKTSHHQYWFSLEIVSDRENVGQVNSNGLHNSFLQIGFTFFIDFRFG